MKVKTLDEEGQRAVAKMIENGYVLSDQLDSPVDIDLKGSKKGPLRPRSQVGIPPDISYKERKLHMKSLKSLVSELEYWIGKFRGSIPKSGKGRFNRLEKVIEDKTRLMQEAIDESSSTSEES